MFITWLCSAHRPTAGHSFQVLLVSTCIARVYYQDIRKKVIQRGKQISHGINIRTSLSGFPLLEKSANIKQSILECSTVSKERVYVYKL